MGEFDLIERFFANSAKRPDVVLGIGDDAALITPPENHQLVITTDTLVEGVHFFADIPPAALGHKSLAVNLSDLAAMGAEPRWVTLAITLPSARMEWLEQFCQGFFELAEYYNVTLVGGDTTRGPLSITVTAHGVIPMEQALTRHQAQVGDWVYVTGSLGGSALALRHLQGQQRLSSEILEVLLQRHYYPQPRVLSGYGLRGVASSCIDLSDGLWADLGHVAKASGCSAKIQVNQLPIHPQVKLQCQNDDAIALALCGGEDYELCFTVPEAMKGSLDVALSYSGIEHCCVGQMIAGQGPVELWQGEQPYTCCHLQGWDHFS
ncbi:thiamine-phosphate kinase [Celerinatantimonas yamalensis]|uniref:Thiamine-monophosphate kinase n=1 Tax=Celerinatantimonas yamalensis TaxID=559956 RepID=A0ABW9G9L6_9GAMM